MLVLGCLQSCEVSCKLRRARVRVKRLLLASRSGLLEEELRLLWHRSYDDLLDDGAAFLCMELLQKAWGAICKNDWTKLSYVFQTMIGVWQILPLCERGWFYDATVKLVDETLTSRHLRVHVAALRMLSRMRLQEPIRCSKAQTKLFHTLIAVSRSHSQGTSDHGPSLAYTRCENEAVELQTWAFTALGVLLYNSRDPKGTLLQPPTLQLCVRSALVAMYNHHDQDRTSHRRNLANEAANVLKTVSTVLDSLSDKETSVRDESLIQHTLQLIHKKSGSTPKSLADIALPSHSQNSYPINKHILLSRTHISAHQDKFLELMAEKLHEKEKKHVRTSSKSEVCTIQNGEFSLGQNSLKSENGLFVQTKSSSNYELKKSLDTRKEYRKKCTPGRTVDTQTRECPIYKNNSVQTDPVIQSTSQYERILNLFLQFADSTQNPGKLENMQDIVIYFQEALKATSTPLIINNGDSTTTGEREDVPTISSVGEDIAPLPDDGCKSPMHGPSDGLPDLVTSPFSVSISNLNKLNEDLQCEIANVSPTSTYSSSSLPVTGAHGGVQYVKYMKNKLQCDGKCKSAPPRAKRKLTISSFRPRESASATDEYACENAHLKIK